ncbi:MAG: V-type ATP synthase subunit A [Peptoniphilaceae bacterium]|nr:V-type ATP synthase subunit A [Peptoniphilaceae bacterium]MDD7383810.1 V-type ATP synthase subunit A [Peptoniphilaceae bacterium]MDY3737792.1 V-type ATP synthase subunit A [Peptoniphilaceae bacterium]
MILPKITMINGPVVKCDCPEELKIKEMVLVGENRLIGEVISIDKNRATIQVYEDTTGLKLQENIESLNKPLSVRLGPGLIGNMFDGIERPLNKIEKEYGSTIPSGLGLQNLDSEKIWDVEIKVKIGDKLKKGDIYATVDETSVIEHKLMSQYDGEVIWISDEQKHKLEDTVVIIKNDNNKHDLKLYQDWSIRIQREVKETLPTNVLLKTGQRILDIFFPVAKGGTVAIPGGFGTGKTSLQHQLAQYCDADIIIYIGCGERGNEMTQVLEDFPKLIDPNTGKDLMERTILIANTSNMPVAAREASIYTGITIAEYYRDMGYDVALMADSTSRWAEALREISGRLEEIPAEEGYPAYLGSRLSQFYERAGNVVNLNGTKGSVTLIGAVSPTGGDFSEPVTENTKRAVNVFLGLDKNLAYSRHYPAINWLDSYSGYIDSLSSYYEDETGEDVLNLRSILMNILLEEQKLKSIVMLIGEDSLNDEQKITMDLAEIIRVGFLQQNAFNEVDKYVPLEKQIEMLKTVVLLSDCCFKSVDKKIAYHLIKNDEIFNEVINMKYEISNYDLSKFSILNNKIENYYRSLLEEGDGIE